MRRLTFMLGAILIVLALLAPGTQAAQKLRVVATIPDLKSLTEAVGGDLVEVESLARGAQSPHEVEVRPSLMLKLRRADLLIENGLELDMWADVVVRGANNPNIIRGAVGRVDVSRGIEVIEVPTTRVDRSLGDVHPLGNPHYTFDPGQASTVTQNIVEGLARIAPEQRATFERNRQAFLGRLDQAMARWTTMLAPFKGAKVVTYHPDFGYFFARFGVIQIGYVEDRPGIPPSPAHLTSLMRQMKDEQIKAIFVEPWNDLRLAARVAEEAGARWYVLASGVGAVKGADDYIAAVEYNVKTLAEALR